MAYLAILRDELIGAAARKEGLHGWCSISTTYLPQDRFIPKMLGTAKLLLYRTTVMFYAIDQMRQHAGYNPTGCASRLRLIVQRATEYRSVEAVHRGIECGTLEHHAFGGTYSCAAHRGQPASTVGDEPGDQTKIAFLRRELERKDARYRYACRARPELP